MKKMCSIFLGFILSLFFIGTSWGTIFNPVECDDGEMEVQWPDFSHPYETLSNWGSSTLTHDNTDNGFDVGVDTVFDATLELFFKNSDWDDIALISIPDWSLPGIYNVYGDSIEVQVNWFGEAILQGTGMLDAMVRAQNGYEWYCPDFFICKKSILSANGREPDPEEPATMLLFGTGLAGLAGWRKKLLNK